MLATTSPSYRRGRRPKLDSIREDRPIVNLLLPAEVSLRPPNGFGKRWSFDCERSLACVVLVPGIIANRFDETHVKRGHCYLLFEIMQQDRRDQLARDQLDLALDRPAGRDNGKADDQDDDDNGNGWREIPAVVRH